MQRVEPDLTRNARALRRDATLAERVLWRQLSSVRPRFTRQLVVGRFIIDIACRSARVAIELDGGQHVETSDADAARTEYLHVAGWHVMRFWNPDVLANPDGVAHAVLAAVAARVATHPRSDRGHVRTLGSSMV